MPANYRPAAARSGSRVGPGKLTAKYASTSLSCPPVRVPSQALNTFPSPERTIISGVPPRPSWGATPYDEIEYTGKLKSCNFAYSVKPPSSREIPTNRYATLARRPRVLMLFALLAHQWQCGFNTYRTLGLGCEANSMLDGSPFRSETRNEVRLVPGATATAWLIWAEPCSRRMRSCQPKIRLRNIDPRRSTNKNEFPRLFAIAPPAIGWHTAPG